MKIDFQVMEALELLERERGVPVDTILDALANALVSAYKRSPGAAEEARVTIDPDSGDIIVYAQELDEDGNVTREWEDTPEDFGRIAAQTAKQVIAQRLREAKREQVFDVYEGREGDLVTGIVQQVDNRYVILDLGDAEAIMPGSERIPYERLERYRPQEWNAVEVTVRGGVATATCNGEVLESALALPASGPIGLEGDRGQMEYRRIRIRVLPGS